MNCHWQLSLDIYKSCRAMVIHLAESHYATGDQKFFVHSTMGQRTLQDEFDKVALQKQGHLYQIAAALA
jgi:hypothetical protein